MKSKASPSPSEPWPTSSRRNGYTTALVGKWHLGLHPKFHPQNRGFDEFFGFLPSGHSYIGPDPDRRNPLLRGRERVVRTRYLAEEFTDEAIAFIDRNKDKAFFLYLSFNAAHTPYHEAPEKYSSRVKHLPSEHNRRIAGMILAADDGIGRVAQKLRELNLERDTLVIFLTDNGSALREADSYIAPFSKGKGSLYEGGIRVPFIVRWPGHVPAGAGCKAMISSLDILPTAMAAAGITPARDQLPLDGVNILPALSGTSDTPPHEYLFWRSLRGNAIRKGRWKLLRLKEAPPALYDLEADLGETINLFDQHPGIVKELDAAYAKWAKGLVDPLW